tara:strand:+ start:117 stop:338 length:222 start_codon:yes stop_codon:yes gene_type:complete
MDLDVGQKYRYKRQRDRGRPFVGELVRLIDDNSSEFVNRLGEREIVENDLITGRYVFKPYMTKKRREENQEIT